MQLRGSIDVSNDRGPVAQLPMCVTVERCRCQSGDIKLTIRGQKADRDVKKIDVELIPDAAGMPGRLYDALRSRRTLGYSDKTVSHRSVG